MMIVIMPGLYSLGMVELKPRLGTPGEGVEVRTGKAAEAEAGPVVGTGELITTCDETPPATTEGTPDGHG
jgi:hypothetical protein